MGDLLLRLSSQNLFAAIEANVYHKIIIVLARQGVLRMAALEEFALSYEYEIKGLD
jgi:hypothetical protein